MNSLASFTSMCVYRYFNVLAYGKSLNNNVLHMGKKAIHFPRNGQKYKALNRKTKNYILVPLKIIKVLQE